VGTFRLRAAAACARPPWISRAARCGGTIPSAAARVRRWREAQGHSDDGWHRETPCAAGSEPLPCPGRRSPQCPASYQIRKRAADFSTISSRPLPLRVRDAQTRRVYEISRLRLHGRAGAGERADPVAFRRGTSTTAGRDVITAAAEALDGFAFSAEQEGERARLAFARVKNLGAYAAVAVEVSLDHESGRVRLVRAAASAG